MTTSAKEICTLAAIVTFGTPTIVLIIHFLAAAFGLLS